MRRLYELPSLRTNQLVKHMSVNYYKLNQVQLKEGGFRGLLSMGESYVVNSCKNMQLGNSEIKQKHQNQQSSSYEAVKSYGTLY